MSIKAENVSNAPLPVFSSGIRTGFSRSWDLIKNPLGGPTSTGYYRVMRCALAILTVPMGVLGIITMGLIVAIPITLNPLAMLVLFNNNEDIILKTRDDLDKFYRTYSKDKIVLCKLTINSNEEHICLPVNLKVKSMRINCPNCKSLKPSGLNVGELDLTGCTSLTELPADLNVKTLILKGCTGLTQLPENLTVDTLDLTGCTQFQELPANLNVKTLILKGCTGLTQLPESLKVKTLNIEGCTQLAIADDFLIKENVTIRNAANSLYLYRTTYNNILNKRIELSVSRDSLDWELWELQHQLDPSSPMLRLTFPHSTDTSSPYQIVYHFLQKIPAMADYKNLSTRPLLLFRLREILKNIEEGDAAFQAACIEEMADGITACGDRMRVALDHLEQQCITLQANREDIEEEQLRQLGINCFLMEKANRHIWDFISKNKADFNRGRYLEVEFFLSIYIAVGENFNLPNSPKRILYPQFGASEEIIQEIIRKITNDNTLENQNAFLNEWEPWKNFQRRKSFPDYGSLSLYTGEPKPFEQCVICFEEDAAKISEPVQFQGRHYCYKCFEGLWKINPINPYTRELITTLSDLFQVTLVPKTSPAQAANS